MDMRGNGGCGGRGRARLSWRGAVFSMPGGCDAPVGGGLPRAGEGSRVWLSQVARLLVSHGERADDGADDREGSGSGDAPRAVQR